jgi:hypothetical protein
MTTTLTPQFQVNLDTQDGATAIHVDTKEQLERIEAFKANLDAKKMADEDEDEEEMDEDEEMDDEDEDEMPTIKGKKGLPPWLKKKDSTDLLERHDSDTLRAYLDSDEEDEFPEFQEGDDLEEVVDSLIGAVQRMDNKLAVAGELLNRQDSASAESYEEHIDSRVDSVLTAFMDTASYLPQGFAYESGMTGGDIYAEAIQHIDSELAEEIDVENADDATLKATFKALKRGDRSDSKTGGKSQNDQINDALNGARADSAMPKKAKPFSMVRGA